MSLGTDVMTDIPSAPADPAPAALPWTRVFVWQVRRELYEHRSVTLGPVIAAGLALFGILITSFRYPGELAAAIANPKKTEHLMAGFSIVCLAVIVIGFLVSIFYCLAALHGERRDRAILFWKSLPVSDRMTVLAKAAVPVLVLPVWSFVVMILAHLVVLAIATVAVMLGGYAPTELWSRLGLPFMWTVLTWGFLVMTLWSLPFWGWLLMVSAWAKRTPILWALGPWLAAALLERIVLRTNHVIHFVLERILGGFAQAFSVGGKAKVPVGKLADLDPVRVFTSPDLWIGLVFAAVFIAVAVRLRRAAGPI